jgi:hypothetical protein
MVELHGSAALELFLQSWSSAKHALIGLCDFSYRRRSRRQRGASGDYVNLEDLPA